MSGDFCMVIILYHFKSKSRTMVFFAELNFVSLIPAEESIFFDAIVEGASAYLSYR